MQTVTSQDKKHQYGYKLISNTKIVINLINGEYKEIETTAPISKISPVRSQCRASVYEKHETAISIVAGTKTMYVFPNGETYYED